jgi:transcriptional regulator
MIMHILHKLNSNMHKSSLLYKGIREVEDSTEPEPDLQHQDRLVKVLTLHSKGFSQLEIARKLDVNQSTVSRDLNEIRKKARKTIDRYISEEIPNEFQIYISGLNEITKNLWGILEDKQDPKISVRDRAYVLSLLMQCYSKRIEMLVGGPDSEMNARLHMDAIRINEKYPLD